MKVLSRPPASAGHFLLVKVMFIEFGICKIIVIVKLLCFLFDIIIFHNIFEDDYT